MKTLSSSLYRTFIGLLREARLNAEVSQVELASRLGRPQSFVSKYESGERRLDVAEFIEICRALDVSATRIIKRLTD